MASLLRTRACRCARAPDYRTYRVRRHQEGRGRDRISVTVAVWMLSPPCSVPLRLRHRCPASIRIEPLHLRERVERAFAEVLLVDDAVVADHEGLDAGQPVFGRRRRQRKAADHHAVDDEVHLAEWRRGPLALEGLEEIAVVRLRTRVVALRDCPRDRFADRTIPGAIALLPGEAILRAPGAGN